MVHHPVISVLTAVYNAEPYLRQCLDSLRDQTFADCQFICIDDCSTDQSYSILQEYAREDSRFQLLRTPVNSGQAKARNLGLQFAKGDYVAMLDADDWFSADCLEQAYHALQQPEVDCAVLQLVQHEQSTHQETPYLIRETRTEWSGEEAFRLSLDWSLHGLYVVRADIHKRFPFDDACRLYSDDNTTRLHYLHSRKVMLCGGKYFYRKYSDSMTNACTIRRFDYMLANLSMKRQLERLAISNREEILDFYEQHRWLNVVGCYWFYYQHRSAFSTSQHEEIHSLFSRILSTIESHRLPCSLKWKLGYYPFLTYACFSRMEDFYFAIRSVWFRLSGKDVEGKPHGGNDTSS